MKIGRFVAIAALAIGLVLTGAPTATATHAYNCDDISTEEEINRAYCSPHCTWDALTGGHWKSWVSYVRYCLLG